MSGAGSGSSASSNPATTRAIVNESSQTPSTLQQQAAKPTQLEEDDEFEDFPVEDWADEDTDAAAAGTTTGASGHLWEESWDDDDTSEDFAQMLKEELKKVGGGK